MDALTDSPAVSRRLEALHALRLSTMPSWKLVAWDLFASVLAFAIGGLLALTWRDSDPRSIELLLFTVGVLVAALLALLRAVSRARVLRSGRFGRAWVLRAAEGEAGGRAGVAVGVGAALLAHDGGLLLDAGIEVLGETAEGSWLDGRRRRRAQKAVAQLAGVVEPGETTLAAMQAVYVPHGWRRVVWWLTLSLASVLWLRGGVFAVTDRRLLFYCKRDRLRRRARLLVDEPLATVRVKEWRGAIGISERFQTVFVLVVRDGSKVRFQTSRIWAREEARRAFELLASASYEPPPVLARFWATGPELREASPQPAAAAGA